MAIYLLHFDRPHHHANHYLGFVDLSNGHVLGQAVLTRQDYHRKGRGSRLLAAVALAGIDWQVVRVWPNGTRDQERLLKGRSSTRLCPLCNTGYAGNGCLDGSLVGTALSDILNGTH